jgi:hypothetical protein
MFKRSSIASEHELKAEVDHSASHVGAENEHQTDARTYIEFLVGSVVWSLYASYRIISLPP